MPDADLALLHQRSKGWPAVLQMAALSLRGTTDPARQARAIEVRGRAVADYFISEVLEQQPPEVVQFMLDTSILAGVLTADACGAVTGRQDAAALLRAIDTAHLFLVALDDERTSYRYHHLVRQVLRAELHARDRGREQALQLRAAEWFEAVGDFRRAASHYLAAQQTDRALALLQDRVIPDFLHGPVVPEPLALSVVDPSPLVETPERLLGLAADMLLSGDTARGGEYLDLLERAGKIRPESALAARLAAFQSFRYGVSGQLEQAVRSALAAQAIQERMQLADEWNAVAPLVLIRVYTCLDDFAAAEREAAATLAAPNAAESVKLIMAPGARALAWFELGHLAEAAKAAMAAAAGAQRLGFSQHFFSIDHLRALSGLALERRDLDTAEHLTEQVLSITEQRRPLFEFLALLDRARIWAARGQVRDALIEQLTAAALEVRATQPGTAPASPVLTEPLTAAEQRILTLLPTSTYLQIADTLYISRNTVKTHLRSIYQKLGVASRSEALARAVDLRLL